MNRALLTKETYIHTTLLTTESKWSRQSDVENALSKECIYMGTFDKRDLHRLGSF